MADEIEVTGLGSTPVEEWKEPSDKELDQPAIDRLEPGSELHKKVLEYLKDRLKMSEDKMSALYPRWEANELTLQAYITLPDYQKRNTTALREKEPPKPTVLVIPYAYATCMTIATYLLHVFCGRRPMFQVSSNKSEGTESAQNMETVLQYNADHCKMVMRLWQYFLDGQTYGLSVLRTTWRNETAMRTIWRTTADPLTGQPKQTKTREKQQVYSGNLVSNVDPYMFFPDPRVPMCEVNVKGEFVFWRSFEGKHTLKKMEADGMVKWVDNAGKLPAANGNHVGPSARNQNLSGTEASPGISRDGGKVSDFIQIDQGTVEVIPKELGLGKSTVPEKWIFAIMNKNQICQAQQFDLDHAMHPVAVTEPYSVGYGFGQPGAVDFITPIQEILSWLVNSHVANVRASLNNMFVVDPSKVEMKDVQDSKPGKVIRLKPAAYGQDVRTIISQLAVADVTANHIRDFEAFMKLGDALTGVNDNLRGQQDSGGRKTATEVRTSSEAGASRLAAQAMVISSQGIADLTKQMSLNIQQFMEDGIYLQIVGKDGIGKPVQIMPEHLVGDFQYPITDGTLPIDRVAMLDVWKEIFLGVAQSPILSQRFDLAKIFEHVAQLGGAKDIKNFEVQIAQPGQGMPPGAIPVGGSPGLPGGSTTPGLTGNAADRVAQ
jgi:hypothetical protein